MALLINEEYIDDEVFLAEFRRLGGLNLDPRHSGARQEADRLSRVAEERVIRFVLLRQKAIAAGIEVTEAEIAARRERQWGTSSASVCGVGVSKAIADDLLVEQYCNWLTRHEPRPSRSEVETYYRAKREELRTPESALVTQVIRNIFFPEDESTARVAMERAEADLQRGVAFRDVAERYSDCGGKVNLGWVKRNEMVDAFEDVVFATPKGKRSSIVRTIFGLHIIHVLDYKAAGYQTLEEVRATLAREMRQARQDSRIRAEVLAASRSAVIRSVPAQASPGGQQEGPKF